jgi:predicted RNase H-like HicB family nuclease
VKYKVVLRQSEEGFSVSCPGLPGCWSQGKTEEEALANIRDAIREYLKARDAAVKDEEVSELVVNAGLTVEAFKKLLRRRRQLTPMQPTPRPAQ